MSQPSDTRWDAVCEHPTVPIKKPVATSVATPLPLVIASFISFFLLGQGGLVLGRGVTYLRKVVRGLWFITTMHAERTVSRTILVMLAAWAFAMPASGQENRASLLNFSARLDALERQIAQLETGQQVGSWLMHKRATEIREVVSDVLLDADSRSSLLAYDVVAGYDTNAFLQSSDGNFRITVRGRLQTRYAISIQDSAPGFDTIRSGFELRRAR